MRFAISTLAKVDPSRLEIRPRLDEIPEDAIPLVVGSIEIFLPLAGMFDLEAERDRLREELHEAQAQIERLENLMAGPFSERAPEEIVKKERRKLEGLRETRLKLQDQLEALEDV
jgi:valyl-tRNA synthetase